MKSALLPGGTPYATTIRRFRGATVSAGFFAWIPADGELGGVLTRPSHKLLCNGSCNDRISPQNVCCTPIRCVNVGPEELATYPTGKRPEVWSAADSHRRSDLKLRSTSCIPP